MYRARAPHGYTHSRKVCDLSPRRFQSLSPDKYHDLRKKPPFVNLVTIPDFVRVRQERPYALCPCHWHPREHSVNHLRFN